MPYNPNVPQALQRISATQQPILGNFTELNTDFNTNHINYTYVNAADRGKHNLVQFVTQAPLAVPAVGATEVGMYNKVPEAPFPITGKQELFVKIPNHAVIGAGDLDIPITAQLYDIGTQEGYFYLPCGLLVKYGYKSTGLVGQIDYPVAANIPVFKGVFWANATTHSNLNYFAVIRDYTTSVAHIIVVCVDTNGNVVTGENVNYIAIGY